MGVAPEGTEIAVRGQRIAFAAAATDTHATSARRGQDPRRIGGGTRAARRQGG